MLRLVKTAFSLSKWFKSYGEKNFTQKVGKFYPDPSSVNVRLPLANKTFHIRHFLYGISNQSMPAVVQSHSQQSQARLMFVTTLTAPKCMHVSKIHNLSMGGAPSRVEARIASPTSPSYVGKQLTALFHTQPLFSFLVYWCVAPTINRVFRLKPSPALESPGHGHLAYDHET